MEIDRRKKQSGTRKMTEIVAAFSGELARSIEESAPGEVCTIVLTVQVMNGGISNADMKKQILTTF